ncbi:MAG: trehalase family glycosidase [Promethearchaeota archaeon]
MSERQIQIKIPELEIVDTFNYIYDYWPELMMNGSSLALPLPNKWIRPGGFFNMFFYWDSYFTSLGLVIQGKLEVAMGILENLFFTIEKLGFVPNYIGKTICSSRSQPPFLTSFIKELYKYRLDEQWLKYAIKKVEQEYYNYWLKSPHLDSSGLSRYIDLGGTGCATIPDTPHFRGIAESGWDNTPRFGDDITNILPIDLNCMLFQYETDLALFYSILGEDKYVKKWNEISNQRKNLIDTYFWDNKTGFYWDYDINNKNKVENLPKSLASFFPLWAGIADSQQAKKLVNSLPIFETDYGLVTCEPGWDNNSQWNYPVGWAPLHWIVLYGLRRYGFDEEAERISMKWLRLLANKYNDTRVLREKYNVVNPSERLPGRYGPQRGFGWTNGVFVAILVRIIFGMEYEVIPKTPIWLPIIPKEWQNNEVYITLPNYPFKDNNNKSIL